MWSPNAADATANANIDIWYLIIIIIGRIDVRNSNS